MFSWLRALFNGGGKKVIGMSVTDRAIRYVVASKSQGMIKVYKSESIAIPGGIIKKGAIVDVNSLVAILAGVRNRNKVNRLFLGLPSTIIKSFSIRVYIRAKMSRSELTKYVEREIASYISHETSYTVQDSIVEYTIYSVQSDYVSVSVSIINNKVKKAYEIVLKRAGFKVLSLGSAMMGLAKLLRKFKNFGKLLVDVSDTEIHIATILNGVVIQEVALSLGGHDLKDLVVKYLGVDDDEGYRILMQYGLTTRHRDKQLLKLLTERMQVAYDLVDYLVGEWNRPAYKNKSIGSIDSIVVTGPYADIPGVRQFLRGGHALGLRDLPSINIGGPEKHAPIIRQTEKDAFSKVLSMFLD